ncbi:TonB-dependent vitamin B12 receptor [Pseudoxanthomonas sangjuensis]|uniref:TonB-dependent vitamin B12 receptor n=1 Tax=Pseudoxanthomonas sangjuensis TaxID=1503750 RepID=UPI001391CC1C|nr:TonB-dependent vitamin B12 receptor [Pseudoxanthomonas sangjuensis]KAF1714269.1 TonB-dependent vitamin B12 receptor [Pseudoxanthomonas sangjuensis]
MHYRVSPFSSRTPAQALAFAIALAPSIAAAQSGGDATELDEVVVTGTRTAVAVEDSLVPAQVIGREEIERSQAQSLAQLLNGRAGISLSNQGGLGKISLLNLRGAEADHVLVLIDGVRVGSATAGLPALQDLPLEQIERIEIVRGPRSSLYGSEAIGGVIQLFTRHGGKGLSRHLKLGGGSNGLREAGGGFSYRGERGWIGADGAYQRTDGIDACRGTAGDAANPFGAGCFADEPDRDGYRNASLSVRGGYQLTGALAAEASFLEAQGDNEFDGSWTNRSKVRQQVIGGKLDFAPSDHFRLALTVGRNRDVSDDYHDDDYVGFFGTLRNQAALQGDYAFADGQLLSVGADWQRDEIDSDTPFDGTERDNAAGFVEYQGQFGAHRVQASVRRDDNDQFGAHTTGSAGYGYAFGNGLTLSANYATGFKAPSFNDLYYPFFGNPDLEPEASKSLNLGVSQYLDGWSWTFNAYETRVDDLVAYDMAIFLPNNIDKARIRGAELTVDATLWGWDVSTQLSHTDPRNDSGGAYDGNLLPRRPRDTARIDIDRGFGALRIGATAFGAGHRYDEVANTTRLPGYGTLDLRASWAINDEWTLQAQARNVFDREYETIAWYNQPGHEYGVTLRYSAK